MPLDSIKILLPLVVLAGSLTLVGCMGKPLEPYTDPAEGTPTANLRIVTNGTVIGGLYSGCIGEQKLLAEAGRTKNGQQVHNWPHHPRVPAPFEMPKRLAPSFPDLPPLRRRAEGSYSEVIAKYKVPAGEPFLLNSRGAVAAGHGSTYFSCPVQLGVFEFEPDKDYELIAGMGGRVNKENQTPYTCPYVLYELKKLPGYDVVYPGKLAPFTPDEENTCAD